MQLKHQKNYKQEVRSMIANGDFEKDLWKQGYKYIAGVDESGIGSLAGDVYVASVIFPLNFDFSLIKGTNDSKQLTADKRKELEKIIKKYALSYSIGTASVAEIDKLNIYWARFLAARRALKQLAIKPDYILMDGNKEIPEINISQQAIVKGDTKSITIAAASILAKVNRDAHIKVLAKKVHSDYKWESNKSYYAKAHIDAIKKHGKTIYHREKFVRKYL